MTSGPECSTSMTILKQHWDSKERPCLVTMIEGRRQKAKGLEMEPACLRRVEREEMDDKGIKRER